MYIRVKLWHDTVILKLHYHYLTYYLVQSQVHLPAIKYTHYNNPIKYVYCFELV